MASADDFGFGEDARILKDTARRFFAERCPPDALHRLVAADAGAGRAADCVWDPALWRQLVDLGWTAVGVPDAAGGFGMGAVACVALAEEIGRAALPCPLGATLAATAVLAACDSEAARDALRRIAEGQAVSPAIVGRDGELSQPPAVTADPGATTRLDGIAWCVQDAMKCDAFVVRAMTSDGMGLYLVDADAPGLRIAPDAIWDLTRDQAHLELVEVEVTPDRVLAAPGAGAAAVRAAEPLMLTLLAADMVGAAEWQLQATADYARTRTQFGRPIGFFQAVKHPLVDMMLAIDEARSLLYDAAAGIDAGDADAEVRARMAKAAASDAAAFCSSRSVQLHGGIGFTWECFVHLYFKRQKHSEVQLGDGMFQRARIAEAVIGAIGGAA